jgi:MYXO-CTERM domain-containing protein
MRVPSTSARFRWISPLLLGAALLAPATALAGEVKFGADPLAVDDKGNITSEGESAALTKLASEPGEELWDFHLWAKIDKGAPGPLYIDFIGKTPDGKPFTAYRHEHSDYDGEKFVSLNFELDGNSASFNKGRTYKVKVLQGATKPGRPDIILATGSLTLEYTEPAPEEEGEGSEEDDASAQDELDTLAGPDEGEGDGPDPAEEGPPPVAPESKKGCSVGSTDLGLPAVAALFALGFVRRRND